MPTWLLIVLIVLVVVVLVLVGLTIWSRRVQKKQEEQAEDIKKQAQTMSLYIIDMKKMHLKDSGLPKIVYESAPRMAKISKVPILKVKAGNQVMSLMCDPEVYKTLAPKQEVRAQVSGMYVVSAKRVRGPVKEMSKSQKRRENLLDKLR